MSRPSLADLSADPESRRVGRFLILRPLGASAEVLEAYDETLGRGVVVRLLPRRLEGDGRMAAMLRHAQALARVTHPNLTRVFEAGLAEDRVYVVMERVEGTPLDEWLTTGPPRAFTARALLGAGRALEALHDAGLAHGAVRPRNVLVTAEGVAHVVGLGDAKPGEEAEASDRVAFAELVRAALDREGAVADARASALAGRLAKGEETSLAPLLRQLAALAPRTELQASARSQRALTITLAASGLAVGASAWLQPTAAFTHERMLRQPLLGLLVIAAGALAFRNALRSDESRRLIALITLAWLAVLVHRVLFFLRGADVDATLVAEALGLALAAVVAAIRHRPWMAWCGAPSVAYAALFTFFPGRAAQSFPLLLGAILSVAAWHWEREARHQPSHDG